MIITAEIRIYSGLGFKKILFSGSRVRTLLSDSSLAIRNDMH